jgi:hypothetical protein
MLERELPTSDLRAELLALIRAPSEPRPAPELPRDDPLVQLLVS